MNEYIGIDIGGTKISVIRGDAAGNILEKKKFATKTKDETLKEIFEGVSELMNEHVTSIGVSCGGPLNSKTGVILGPPNLPGWDEVPITDMLTETFGIPAYLKNDADACAVAEWKFGAGKGTENMIFLTFGTGIGAGLILNGRLYEGSTGMARTVMANNKADCHIALHWDSTKTDKGAFYMSVPNNAAYRAMEPVASNWESHNKLGSALVGGLKQNGVKIFSSGSMEMDLTQTSYSTVPSIDIELGDGKSAHDDATLGKLADGLVVGVNSYFGQ